MFHVVTSDLPAGIDEDTDVEMENGYDDTMSLTSSQFEAEMEDATSRIVFLKLCAAGD